MIRLIGIPILGTVLALVVVLLAHEPNEPAAAPAPPVQVPQPPGPYPPRTDEPEPAPRPRPKPRAEQYEFRVDKDGSFLDLDRGTAYASAAELIGSLGAARHTLVLTNGPGVDEAALDEALARLRDHYVVRKIYRVPEKEEK